MRGTRRRHRIAIRFLAGVAALAAAGMVSGEVSFKTWPPAYRWHTFYGSGDPESGGSIVIDGGSRTAMIGLSYQGWLGPAGQAPLRAFAPGDANAVIVQTDAVGAYRWHAFYPCALDGIAAGEADTLYVTGSSRKSWTGPAGQPPLHAHPGGASAIVVLKLDADGSYLWHSFYGSGHANYNNGGAAVAGSVWVTGHTAGASWTGPAGQAPLTPFSGLEDAFVLKLSAAGAYQWHAFYGSGSDVGRAVAIDAAGDVAVLLRSQAAWSGPSGHAPLHAYHSDGSQRSNLAVLKLRGPDGAYQWHTFYGSGSDVGNGLATVGSDIVVTGQSGAAWNGPAGQPPLGPYLAPAANPYTLVALKLAGTGAYAWHSFLGAGGVSGNAVASDGLAVYLVADCWASWNGPGGQLPAMPFSGWSSIALVALETDGAYRGHTFLGTSTGGQGLAVRSGTVVVGGTGGAAWDGPAGEPPRHAYANSGDLVVVRVVPECPALVLSNEGARLIEAMSASGHGDVTVYEAVAAMQANSAPPVAGVITDAFVDALASCPPGSPVMTGTLADVAGWSGAAVCADCSVREVAIEGRALLGQPGTTTLTAALPTVGTFDLTSTASQSPLASWQADGTTYNAFAIAWAVRRGSLRRVIPGHGGS